MLKAIFFDLDGTLLPMDQEEFLNAYFSQLSHRMAPLGYDPKALIDTVMRGTYAMIKNDGTKTNEQVFWQTFCSVFGEDAIKDKDYVDAFYSNEFLKVQSVCPQNPKVPAFISHLKEKNLRLILATSPIFPEVGTYNRIRWAGLDPSDFEFITTYENSSVSKPNLEYYKWLLDKFNLDPAQCLMVGNDVGDDMVAESLNMKVFLLTDYLINRNNTDVSHIPQGNVDALCSYIDTLI